MLQGLSLLGERVGVSCALSAARGFARCGPNLVAPVSVFGAARGIIAALAFLTSANPAAADEMSAILGCGQSGAPCGSANGLVSGNISAIEQNGSFGSASVEQQAILGAPANVTSIQQNGIHDSAVVTQTGGQNATGITQTGNYNSLTLNQLGGASAFVTQTGNSLGLNINQGQNTFIGVSQSGSGAGVPVTIYTVK